MKDNKLNGTTHKGEPEGKVEEKPVLSRKERKELKKREREEKTSDEAIPKKVRWVQIRMIPILLRIILVIVLLVGVVIIGLRIGYGYVGDGNPSDVLKKETWLHIVDIIKGKE